MIGIGWAIAHPIPYKKFIDIYYMFETSKKYLKNNNYY
jgi:hypothetical protein